eukprot:gene24932-biopygen14992
MTSVNHSSHQMHAARRTIRPKSGVGASNFVPSGRFQGEAQRSPKKTGFRNLPKIWRLVSKVSARFQLVSGCQTCARDPPPPSCAARRFDTQAWVGVKPRT